MKKFLHKHFLNHLIFIIILLNYLIIDLFNFYIFYIIIIDNKPPKLDYYIDILLNFYILDLNIILHYLEHKIASWSKNLPNLCFFPLYCYFGKKKHKIGKFLHQDAVLCTK